MHAMAAPWTSSSPSPQVTTPVDGTARVASLDDVAGRNACSWRQRALAHIAELQSQLEGLNEDCSLAHGAQRHLNAAREAAAGKPSLAGAWSGFDVDRTWANINKAEVALLRLMPDAELPWWGSDVLARALQHLGPQDPRRAKLEEHLRGQDGKLLPQDRTLAAITLQAANIAAQLEKVRLRSFRNTILVSTCCHVRHRRDPGRGGDLLSGSNKALLQ